MEVQNCLNDAITDVLTNVRTWDIPDESFAQAVNDRACQLAGINPEEIRRAPLV